MPIAGSGGVGDVSRSFGIDRVRRSTGKDKVDSSAHDGAQSPDGVALSSEAKALLSIQSAPDIRQDKVDALKRAIADGSYQVSSRDLAKRLLDSGAI